MLTYLIPSRRRAEAARVERFVDAIRVSEHGTVTEEEKVVPLPLSLVRLMVPLAMAAPLVLLTGCGGSAGAVTPEAPAQQQPAVQTLAPEADELTGTDAGLVGPAPTVAELEAVPDAIPADIPAPVSEPAPVQEYAAPNTWADTPDPEHVQEQLPEESTGRQIDCPDGTVGTVTGDGTLDCGQ